ncbi:E3 ubiquitin-protein ligase TRIM7-like isoform X1 [Lathamus discolor]|uniref:E3 ubiquitin-protein ligase TRIM7-like isoform X1 n=1 Tax=Lathamus discolor TaxID=678569 RepID=UPI0032B72DC0
MAAQSPADALRSEASCPVCLGYFQDPVSIPCGHNFCRACISRCWEGLEAPLACPQCRQPAPQRSLRPSRELGNIALIARGMSPGRGGGGWGWEALCGQHQEALKLFCTEDLQPICVVCDRARAHRGHSVVPIEEAAEKYKWSLMDFPAPLAFASCRGTGVQAKRLPWETGAGVIPVGKAPPRASLCPQEQILSCLRAGREEREKYLESRKAGGRRSPYLDRSRAEGARLAAELRRLQRFLREQERLLLAELAALEGALGRAQERAAAQVSAEMARLDAVRGEVEAAFQQPPSRVLQDIRRLLKSCEMTTFKPPAEISSHLERRLEDFVQRNVLVRGTLRRCQDSLMFKLQEPTSITLDPSTAHPNLRISEDLREARGHLRAQDVPDTPWRFDYEPCVLGQPGLTSGRHFWDVDVGQGGVWALGVARASIPRKGPLSLTPKDGVWALEAFHSLTSPRASARPSPVPSRIRVSLDYEGGRVAFFSAADEVPLLVYTRASFNGERLLPWFRMGMGARLQDISRALPSEEQPPGGQLMAPLDWVGFRFPLRICP